MELDKETIKALSAETRITILKALLVRRKMPTELSKQMGLAKSTIAEHLKILENSGLINRVETGHKWIYYELTSKGKNLVAPKIPVQFFVILTLGVLFMFAGLNNYLVFYTQTQAFSAEKTPSDLTPSGEAETSTAPAIETQTEELVTGTSAVAEEEAEEPLVLEDLETEQKSALEDVESQQAELPPEQKFPFESLETLALTLGILFILYALYHIVKRLWGQ